MRISTKTIFESGAARLSDLQSSLVKAQQQISTGRRMLTPADDPVAAARALEVTQSQDINQQQATNRSSAKDSLSQEEVALQGVTDLLQDVRTVAVSAGNGALDDQQRGYLATELRGRLDDLLGMANTKDGSGNYLFSGFQTSSQPFVQSGASVSYNGDQGQRLLQVDSAQQIALSDSGAEVFQNIRSGNGRFVTAAGNNVTTGGPNIGNGVVSAGSIVDASQLTGDKYTVTFSVAGGVTTYNILNTTTGNPVGAVNAPYTDGQSIAFDGLQFNVTGAPGDGDTVTVNPSTNQSVFTTLQNLIDTLSKPTDTPTGKANLANGLSSSLTNIDNALDNVLTVRASVGSRLKQIDSLDDIGSDRDLQYSATLSGLQDLDYSKAITQLTQQQVTLQAAQQSFVKITGLSLFNYLGNG